MLHLRLDTVLYERLARAGARAVLVSPFLTMPIARELKRLHRESRADWTLITRLDPHAVAARVLSTNAVIDLIEDGVHVHDLPGLHAKVFLVDDDFAVVGSANLTGPGLGSAPRSNTELSVQLEPAQIPALAATVASWGYTARPVTIHDVRQVEEAARRLPRPSSPVPDLEPALRPQPVLLPAIPADVSLWAKAQFGPPDWDQWRHPHWFSSRGDRRPGFAPGDLVVIYAKDAHACYAVVEVTDGPVLDPEFVTRHRDNGERWPWVNRTRPFLVPDDGITVSPIELGFTGQGLQGGHKRLDLSQFLTAVDALSPEPTADRDT